MACALKGLVIIQIPQLTSLPYLRSGELRELLPAHKPKSIAVSVVCPQNEHLSHTMRAFVDRISELFKHFPLLVDDPRRQITPCEVMHRRNRNYIRRPKPEKIPLVRRPSASSIPAGENRLAVVWSASLGAPGDVPPAVCGQICRFALANLERLRSRRCVQYSGRASRPSVDSGCGFGGSSNYVHTHM
ncbi:LysR substrate-binding domain-containing protein [Paraburkholderia sp. D1E]|uniref:LysR substrate-binding domain-containing protein n=1 Tax=Paraburkholderia sp. D1E TaxID=3461398 RepID=UPI004045CB74